VQRISGEQPIELGGGERPQTPRIEGNHAERLEVAQVALQLAAGEHLGTAADSRHILAGRRAYRGGEHENGGGKGAATHGGSLPMTDYGVHGRALDSKRAAGSRH
jgi:hypothetical protein